MQVAAYIFQDAGRTYTVRLRSTETWRVKIDEMPVLVTFADAQDAVDHLHREHGLPRALDAWQTEAPYRSPM